MKKKALVSQPIHYKCESCGKKTSSTRIYKKYFCESCQELGFKPVRSFWQALYDWI